MHIRHGFLGVGGKPRGHGGSDEQRCALGQRLCWRRTAAVAAVSAAPRLAVGTAAVRVGSCSAAVAAVARVERRRCRGRACWGRHGAFARALALRQKLGWALPHVARMGAWAQTGASCTPVSSSSSSSSCPPVASKLSVRFAVTHFPQTKKTTHITRKKKRERKLHLQIPENTQETERPQMPYTWRITAALVVTVGMTMHEQKPLRFRLLRQHESLLEARHTPLPLQPGARQWWPFVGQSVPP